MPATVKENKTGMRKLLLHCLSICVILSLFCQLAPNEAFADTIAESQDELDFFTGEGDYGGDYVGGGYYDDWNFDDGSYGSGSIDDWDDGGGYAGDDGSWYDDDFSNSTITYDHPDEWFAATGEDYAGSEEYNDYGYEGIDDWGFDPYGGFVDQKTGDYYDSYTGEYFGNVGDLGYDGGGSDTIDSQMGWNFFDSSIGSGIKEEGGENVSGSSVLSQEEKNKDIVRLQSWLTGQGATEAHQDAFKQFIQEGTEPLRAYWDVIGAAEAGALPPFDSPPALSPLELQQLAEENRLKFIYREELPENGIPYSPITGYEPGNNDYADTVISYFGRDIDPANLPFAYSQSTVVGNTAHVFFVDRDKEPKMDKWGGLAIPGNNSVIVGYTPFFEGERQLRDTVNHELAHLAQKELLDNWARKEYKPSEINIKTEDNLIYRISLEEAEADLLALSRSSDPKRNLIEVNSSVGNPSYPTHQLAAEAIKPLLDQELGGEEFKKYVLGRITAMEKQSGRPITSETEAWIKKEVAKNQFGISSFDRSFIEEILSDEQVRAAAKRVHEKIFGSIPDIGQVDIPQELFDAKMKK